MVIGDGQNPSPVCAHTGGVRTPGAAAHNTRRRAERVPHVVPPPPHHHPHQVELWLGLKLQLGSSYWTDGQPLSYYPSSPTPAALEGACYSLACRPAGAGAGASGNGSAPLCAWEPAVPVEAGCSAALREGFVCKIGEGRAGRGGVGWGARSREQGGACSSMCGAGVALHATVRTH